MSAGLVLLHAWWGLNDDVRDRAASLRSDGYAVVTPDLFGGRTATTVEGAKALTKGEQENEAKIAKIVDDAVADLGRKVDHVGLVGWSFGNWYAWKAAKADRAKVGALVLFYGIALDDPAAPVAPVLSHYAELDEFEDLADTRKVQGQMNAAGNDVRLEVYPGTKHWFDEPSRPEYDKAASDLAWERTRAFLATRLR